jgi:hypothetical protein
MNRGRIIAVCAAGVFALSATSAHAGEITGTGEDTPIRSGVASSACAYSGLNDNTGGFVGSPVQNFGAMVKASGPLGGIPGQACRGN